MASMDILEDLFDKKILSVLRCFFDESNKQFYLRELSKITGVSVATTFRIINKLVSLKLINQYQLGKFKVYKLGDNENTRFLGQIIKKEKQVLQLFITRVKDIPGLQEVILQGNEEKDRANVVIVGEGIDMQQVRQLCSDIKEQLKYLISPLVVNMEQFEQMSQMYPMKKTVLFKK